MEIFVRKKLYTGVPLKARLICMPSNYSTKAHTLAEIFPNDQSEYILPSCEPSMTKTIGIEDDEPHFPLLQTGHCDFFNNERKIGRNEQTRPKKSN